MNSQLRTLGTEYFCSEDYYKTTFAFYSKVEDGKTSTHLYVGQEILNLIWKVIAVIGVIIIVYRALKK